MKLLRSKLPPEIDERGRFSVIFESQDKEEILESEPKPEYIKKATEISK